MRGGERGRGRGRGDRGGFGPRGRRAEFSAVGPSEDTTITTIVVEQIPEDKFEEAAVRDFFSQYGEIVDITMQPHRKLALITYDTHASAKQAWSSPKVIFDNRFVKVYWYKPKPEKNGDRPTSGDAQGEVPAFNREEFERQQDEAQKMHEEKKKKRQETEEAKQALDKQREELLMKQQEEKDKLLQRIGAAESSNGGPEGAPEPAADDSANDQTKQLRAKLASLEEEAKGLGLDPSGADTGSFAPRGRGRGSYRGRGYAPRGRGYDPSFRGGYRGRGGFRGRGGVLRLDNRPKRVGVSGVEFNSEKDEALRQFLIVSDLAFDSKTIAADARRELASTNPSSPTRRTPTRLLWHSRNASRQRSSCSGPGRSRPSARSSCRGCPTHPWRLQLWIRRRVRMKT